MKRLIAALIILVMLTGCGGNVASDATEAPVGTTAPVQTEPSLLDPENVQAQLSGGALRAFPLAGKATQMAQLGSELMVFLQGQTEAQGLLLTGKDCYVKARASLPATFPFNTPAVLVDQTGVVFFDPDTKELVVMDNQLRQNMRIPLPKDLEGMPAISDKLDAVYYCTGTDIRAYDLQSGQSRLLKAQDVETVELLQCCFGGTMLVSRVTESDGDQEVSFLSVENGETIGRDTALEEVQIVGEQYLLQRQEHMFRETLVGERNATVQALNLETETAKLFLLEGKLIKAETYHDVGTKVVCIDLKTGKKEGEMTLVGTQMPHSFLKNKDGIWFLAEDKQGESSVLYCWDTAKSAVEDDATYIGKRYTAKDPDTEGLAQCQKTAEDISKQIGVKVLIWEDAVAQPGEYVLEAAYQPEQIQAGLENLAYGLGQYPDTFFEVLGSKIDSGELRICLVDSISGDVPCAQYWIGGEAYVVLTLGEDMLGWLYHSMSHVMDTYIFANSRAYDDWEKLNPADFSYDHNYDVYATREDSPYLQGERAFASSYAMTFPKEDRAMILQCAMQPGNEDLFAHPIMQTKLAKVCEAIREAFKWEDVQESFAWEQYLIPTEE